MALKLHKSMPETFSALIDIGVEQKLLRMDAEEKRAVLAEREAREAERAALRDARHRRKSNSANDNAKQAASAA